MAEPALKKVGHSRSERHPPRGEVIDFAEASKRVRAHRFAEKILFQDRERNGELQEDDLRIDLIRRIQTRLYEVASNLPRGQAHYLQSQEINAFAVKGMPDVFIHDGLLRQFLSWCEQNNQIPSEDAVAMVMAHEMGHILQGTEEVDFDDEEDEEERHKPKDRKEAEKLHQQQLNNEYDADRYGLQLIARAGYNPREGLKILRFLLNLSEGTSLPTTHPRSTDRLRELIALVESPDTIIPNTDREPTSLDKELIRLLTEKPTGRPATEVYRGSAMGKLSEYMAEAGNIHDALEVAQVAFMHRHFSELDAVRRSQEARTAYAKQMLLENVRILLQAMEYRYRGSEPFGISVLYSPADVPNSRIKYAAREYGYASPIDGELSVGRATDIAVADAMGENTESSLQFIHRLIDQEIDRVDQKELPKCKPGSFQHDRLIQYQTKLKEVKSAVDAAVASIEENAITTFIDTVDDSAKDGDWTTSDDTLDWITNSSGADMVEWCTKNGTPIFARLLNPDDDKLKEALGGVAETDSRYQPFLDPNITRSEDLLSVQSRSTFIEQSILATVERPLNTADNGTFEVRDAYDQGTTQYTSEMIPTLAAQFASRYAVLGSKAEPLAVAMATALLGGSYKQERMIDDAIYDLPDDSFQIWSDQVPPLAGDFSSSASALFLSESGLSGQLIGHGRSNLHAKLYRLEERCLQATQRRMERRGVSKPTLDITQMLDRLTVASEHKREDYIRRITDQLETEDWDKAVVATFEEKLSPVLQVLSAKERLHVMNVVVGPGHMGRDQMPNLVQIITYSMDACPEYANKLLTWRWEQVITIEPEADRFTFIEMVYANADSFDALRANWYGKPSDDFKSKIGKEYFRLHAVVHGEEQFPDALVKLTESKLLTADKNDPLFGDLDIQRRIDALSEDNLLRVADAAKQTYVGSEAIEILHNGFLNAIMERTLQVVGVVAAAPFNRQVEFNTTAHSFDVVFGHIGDHVVDLYRDRLLGQCQQAYGISGEELVSQGQVSRFDPIKPSVMISGTPLRYFPDPSVDRNAARYKDSFPPFHQTRLSDHSNRATAIAEFLVNNSITTDRTRDTASRITAVVELIPEMTDYRDALLLEIESDFLNEHGLTTRGHRVEAGDGPVEIAAVQQLYSFYEQAIPFCAQQVQAQVLGRRAYFLYEQHLVESQTSLDRELERVKKLFPSVSFARDEALLKIGNSNLVRTPEQARAVQALTTDMSRRSEQQQDLNNQSQLERLNVIMGTLSRVEKKDFLLWVIGASNEPPKSLKAYGGIHEVSFGDVPAMVFAATAPEREQLLLRMMTGSNGLLEPQDAAHEAVLTEFIDTAFNEMFPDNDTEGVTGETRRILHTIFTTVFAEYDSYRGGKIFIGMVEALQDERGNRGKRIVTLLSELGPVFVKVGQVLSETESAPGVPLLPEDIRREMRTLKQDAKRFSRLAAVFSLESANEFKESNPHRIAEVGKILAAASIKQVSDAKRVDGRTVVEKVLRPSIEKHLAEDIRVLGVIVKNIREYAEVPRGVEEVGATYVQEEADFAHEVASTEKISRALTKYQKRGVIRTMAMRTPEIYSYSRRHIQEEKIRGISFEELMSINRDSEAMETVAAKHGLSAEEREYYMQLAQEPQAVQLQVFDAMAYQYFQANAFHGDPHGGNILLPVEGGIGIIDSGSIGESNNDSRRNLKRFFTGFALGNTRDVRQAVEAFAPGISAARLNEVMAIVESDLGDSDKMKQILKVTTEGTTELHPTFDKFLKSFATGAYLMNGLDPRDVRLIIGAYSHEKLGLNTSLVAVGATRIMREKPDSYIGRLLAGFFEDK